MNEATAPVKRSGGLTAVAILNLVFAVLGMLGGAALYGMNKDTDQHAEQADQLERISERQRADMTPAEAQINENLVKGMADQMRNHSPAVFRWMFAAGLSGGLLLFASGIGLLGMKRVTGFHAALAAAVALIACGMIAVLRLGFLFWGIPMLGAVYAIVMGLLMLFVFRPVLTR